MNDNDTCHIDGTCAECGAICTSITIDIGIGAYEFWGYRGTHIQYEEVSPCCEAEVSPLAKPERLIIVSTVVNQH